MHLNKSMSLWDWYQTESHLCTRRWLYRYTYEPLQWPHWSPTWSNDLSTNQSHFLFTDQHAFWTMSAGAAVWTRIHEPVLWATAIIDVLLYSICPLCMFTFCLLQSDGGFILHSPDQCFPAFLANFLIIIAFIPYRFPIFCVSSSLSLSPWLLSRASSFVLSHSQSLLTSFMIHIICMPYPFGVSFCSWFCSFSPLIFGVPFGFESK